MSVTPGNVTIDLREIAPSARQEFKPRILSAFENLAVGCTLSILNDHDPVPLRYLFHSEYGGEFEWEYSESGPVDWKIDITRVKPRPAHD